MAASENKAQDLSTRLPRHQIQVAAMKLHALCLLLCILAGCFEFYVFHALLTG